MIELGNRYGFLTTTGTAVDRGGRPAFTCVCDCGSVVTVAARSLKSGNTKSCGCYHRKRAAEVQTVHGASRRGRRTAEWNIWRGMIQRTEDPGSGKYYRYGARGIRVCDRWRHDFAAFLADMGERPSPKHSIDRIDNDGPYSPENCRWATAIQQANNKSSSTKLTAYGITMSNTQWAKVCGVAKGDVIRKRLLRGATPEAAVGPFYVAGV